jgi:signal transduction histidine kinase
MVRISPNRFPQLVVNLLLNAADVMPDGGALAIGTTRSNGGVRLAFEDEGPGVPLEDRERIFQPFYTTKDPGKGTGLGLAVSRRIAEEHGGGLTVRDAEGGGAAFDLWLPLPEGER